MEERRGGGTSLYQAWISEDFPRLILVTFQHPTPYYDDSYAVDSANNGPYGQAIMTELIPYLEEHFRILREPSARLLTGGSTGTPKSAWASMSVIWRSARYTMSRRLCRRTSGCWRGCCWAA